MRVQDKRYFTDEEIDRIRDRFHVERTIDEVLTSKLRRRRGSDYHPLHVDEIRRRLHAFLADELDADYFLIRDLMRLPGGASKEQFVFSLVRHGELGERTDRMVLRMNPGESVVETHRLREFQVLRAVRGTIPVPPVYWVDADGSKLGQPGMVCGLVSGVTKSRQVTSGKVSGMGMGFPTDLRRQIFPQFVEHLAAIHRYDWRNHLAELSAFDVPRSGTKDAALWNVEAWRRVWEEDCTNEHPVMTLAYLWLSNNLPDTERISLVHNDYRSGNFLFDEESAQITAILDWELSHLGDFHEDLAWVLFPGFAATDEETGRPLVCGFVERDEFLAYYEKISGIRVDEKRLVYYQILSAYKMAVMAAGTCVRVVADRQSHIDVMLNFGAGIGVSAIKELWVLLSRQNELGGGL